MFRKHFAQDVPLNKNTNEPHNNMNIEEAKTSSDLISLNANEKCIIGPDGSKITNPNWTPKTDPRWLIKPQSTDTGFDMRNVYKFKKINPDADDYVDPNAPNDEFLKGPQPIEAELVSIQEGEEEVRKIKSKTEVPLLNLTEKEAFYKIAIEKDEKIILGAKERIKYNKIRLRKLVAYMAAEARRKEKALMDL